MSIPGVPAFHPLPPASPVAMAAPPPSALHLRLSQSPPPATIHDDNALREGATRWLGFLNELAESARFLIPPPVLKGSYVVATGYAIVDALNLGRKTYARQRQQGDSTGHAAWRGALVTTDAMLFHLNATIAGLPLIIAQATRFAKSRLNPALANTGWRRFAPLAAGLATIGALYKGYDKLTDMALDVTFRRWFDLDKKYLGRPSSADASPRPTLRLTIVPNASLRRPPAFEHFA